MALRVRKLLLTAIYEKLSKLSMTTKMYVLRDDLIDTTMLNCEDQMKNQAFFYAGPIVQIIGLLFVWILSDGVVLAIAFALLLLISLAQFWLISRQYMNNDLASLHNSSRLQLISNAIQGYKTMKANAAEDEIVKKINLER